MALSLDDFFQISIDLQVSAATPRELGITLHLTTDPTLDAAGPGRIRTFGSADAVEAVFPADSEPVNAARVYFAARPRPRPLQIGRWNNASGAGTTITGGAHRVLSTLTGVSNGGFSLGGEDFTGVDLSGDSSLAEVATAIQTELRTSSDSRFSGALAVYNNGRFVITLPSMGDVGGVLGPPSAGVNLAPLLGLDAASGAVYRQGGPVETISEALAAIRAVNAAATILTLDPVTNGTQQMLDAAEWAGARDDLVGCITSNEEAALVPNETGSFLYRAWAASHQVVATHTKKMDSHASLGVAALLSQMNLTLPDALKTLNLATINGVEADEYNLDERTELRRKRANYYAFHDRVAAYADGRTLSPGLFADTKYWMIWLDDRMRVSLLQHYQATRAVRLTDEGMARQLAVADNVMAAGVRNGGLAPGYASPGLQQRIATTIRKPDFDGYLGKGYLGYIDPISYQTQVDRDNRISLPMSEFGKLAGSAHSLAVGVTLEN